ncbi:hypothetical protein LPJ70_004007, partial [Coemansia sp. RSA 2708]
MGHPADGGTGGTSNRINTMPMAHKNTRPLRSWSSSEKSASDMEVADQSLHGARRFSVAAPASSSGSRKSHTPRSLPTWAEEEDESSQDPSRRHKQGAAHPVHLGSGANAVHNMHVHNPNGNYASRHAHVYVRRAMPDMYGLADGSSSSSNGPPSMQQSNGHSGSSSSSDSRHQRLRTPYSISIPSMVGSPLSFTQSFLASRTSMYAKRPPSSQMRAARIDWDNVSMMDELSSWSSNRAELLWQGKGPRAHMVSGSGLSLLPHQYMPHMPGTFTGQAHPQAMHPRQAQFAAPPAAPAPEPEVHAAMLSDSDAPADAWGSQAAWDYACYHHPLLASFSVASGLQLSSRWRWGLLCVLTVSTLCVLIGTPVALAVLLGREAA